MSAHTTKVESMAERAHEISSKHGTAEHIYHPRIRSYGRRVEAALPGTLTLIAALAFLGYKRPALPYTIVTLLIAFCAGISLYSVLKPTIVALTDTHVLRARLIGWKAVPLKNIDHTILVEKLYPKQAHGKKTTGMGRLRYRPVPAMWAIGKNKKPLMRLDGRVWDAKTMRTVSSKLSEQTTVCQKANVLNIDKLHPHLITFNELHPGWRSATIAVVAALVILLLGAGALLPEETARAIHLISS